MTGIDNPKALLTAAADRLVAADSWTLTAHPDYFHLEAAIRPSVQWHRTEAIFGGDADAVLIRGGFAYLYGIWQAPMIGWTRSEDAVEAVIGDRWLQCDAAAFLHAGNDHGALQQVLKLVGVDPTCADPTGAPSFGTVRVHRIVNSSAGPVAILSGRFGGTCAVRLEDPEGPLLVGFGSDPAEELTAYLSYGDDELALPDPTERGVVTLEAAMAGFGARRTRRPKPPKTSGTASPVGRAAKVDVTAPGNGNGAAPGNGNGDGSGDQSWSIHSDDLLPAWGVESGYQAEELVRELLSQEAPQLIGELVFDSYAEAFVVYTESAAVARAVAELLRRKPA